MSDNSDTLFAQSNPFEPGIMQVDLLKNGAVRLAVIEYRSDHHEGVEVYSRYMAEPGSRPGRRH